MEIMPLVILGLILFISIEIFEPNVRFERKYYLNLFTNKLKDVKNKIKPKPKKLENLS